MYLLYIDESENSDKRSKISPSVFGLSGLLITARYIPAFVETINNLKGDFKISLTKEIKGYEIFNQNKWCNLSDDERRDFCKKLSESLVGKNGLAKAFFIFKNSKFQRDDYLLCLGKIIDKSSEFIAKHGSNTSKQLLVVFDEKDEFENDINNTIVEKRAEILKFLKEKHKKICRIIDHGFPGKSKMSEMLQASDFLGYVLRLSKTLQRGDSLFQKGKDERFIKFVDNLVTILKTKTKVEEI
jgi:hypothetical protein